MHDLRIVSNTRELSESVTVIDSKDVRSYASGGEELPIAASIARCIRAQNYTARDFRSSAMPDVFGGLTLRGCGGVRCRRPLSGEECRLGGSC